jgi:hypothetical protein
MEKYALARQEAEARFEAGWRPQKLLAAENVKLRKAEKFNWRGLGLSLAPADVSGHEVCASRSPNCTQHCIFSSGHGFRHQVQMGRIFRTIWFFRDRKGFMTKLLGEIQRNQDAAIRLNVFSDIQWERQFPEIMGDFPETQFYDYTKHFKRMFRGRPSNYHLTFSLHEKNEHQAREVLDAGMNVAAVTDQREGKLFGYPVIDGDEHDLRFLDPSPVVVGLKAKGSLRTDPDQEMSYVTEIFKLPAAA